MNIPLTFLCEQLGVKAPESNLDIVDVRMLVPGEVAFEPGILYVGGGLDSSVSSSKNAPANEYAFEVLGLDAGHPAKTLGVTSDRPDEVAELASEHPIETVELAGAAAVLHTAGDSSTMLNRVLALMSRVRAWEDEVTSILLDKGGMNGVMHLFSHFMGNAAYLVDSSFRVIAIDDDPALSEMSAIWRHIRNYGFVPLDIITGMRRSGELGDLDSSREPTLFKSSYFNNEFVNANVWRGDRLWGHLFFVGYEKKITPGDLLISAKLRDVIACIIEDDVGYVAPRGRDHENFFQHVLDGSLKDPTLINRQLASLGWCREGRYIAAVAKVLDDDAVLQELLCSNIENSSDGKTVIAGPDVVAVFPLRADEGTERIETWLATFAHSNGSRVGVSDAFSGFEGLPVYAEQARAARKFADGAVREHNDGEPEVVLARYADHAVEDLLSHLDSVYDIDIFCDPSVSVLRAYDEAHGGDLLHTLEVYLTCDCSLLESSRALVIHRNTMVYRMRRIVELTGLDLNDSQTLVRLSLSVRLLTARKATQ